MHPISSSCEYLKSPTPALLNDSQYQSAFNREFQPFKNQFVHAISYAVDTYPSECTRAIIGIYEQFIGRKEFLYQLNRLKSTPGNNQPYS